MNESTKVAHSARASNLHDAERGLLNDHGIRQEVESILRFVDADAQELELHEVERELFRQLLKLGQSLLERSIARRGTGKEAAGDTITTEAGVCLPYHTTKTRKNYLSIFGEVDIRRAYYWVKGEKGVFPIDEDLNLPERRYSYLLQEWVELLGVDCSFEQASDRLDGILGVKVWTQGVQNVSQAASTAVQPFYETEDAPAEETEGELLIATIDGKGVPIRSTESLGEKIRLAPGEKPGKKREALVSAVYTVARYHRTPEDVVREIDEYNRVIKPDPAPPPRPKPQNKRVRATLGGKDEAFREVRRQLHQRDPDGKKQRVALTDGAQCLQAGVLNQLEGESGIVLILDIMHVLSYLWPVAFADHKEGSPEASRWVMNKLRVLLEGKVGYVIGALRQRLGRGDLSASKRKDIEKAIRYMDRNRAFMEYDVYLAEGFPIGSGVVEGACKHLVKDRMERTGMRWTMVGAEAMLELRAVELNGNWGKFWRFHAAQERERLYRWTRQRCGQNAA